MTLAEQLHIWYLEATKELNPESYNAKAQVPYSELTEEQKFIDKFIADKFLQIIKDMIGNSHIGVIGEPSEYEQKGWNDHRDHCLKVAEENNIKL